jgi:hypothetical protein
MAKVEADAKAKSEKAKPVLMSLFVAARADFTNGCLAKVLDFVGGRAELHINLNVSKAVGGKVLMQVLCEDTDRRYKNQFETGASGGALAGKARRDTEKELFGPVA